ncbi:putative Transcription factor IIIC subunit 5 [Klebsormidium nitens]|uniref:Putative Transcription factor IIIC subunit 5 n=1 Tax=Klebsormidium nitens TaxID=105231 RepID=A0A1Y1ILM9_KLENI|nr:putative Transcription factor IIIC subunit 5 [Klebsormidium nitens]|eukprot:GAQ89537.1 putative Transcription factor IIIC subunit 5 [Klebsormidium nitens]
MEELQEGELADFVFTPSSKPGREASRLIPPRFSRVRFPQEYFFVNKMTDPEALRMENGEEGHATGPATGSFGLDFGIDFREGQLPPEPSESDFGPPDSLAESEKGLWEHGMPLLRSLFDERPIWSRAMIQSCVDATWTHLVRPMLLKLAYTFHNGPWRLLWVKKGADPRTDPSLRKYQLLDFRVPRAWYDAMPKGHEAFFQSSLMRPWGGMLNSPRWGGETEEAVATWRATQRFERAPVQRSTFFQLCDLEDDDIQRHLAKQPVPAACDSTSGWYTSAALSEHMGPGSGAERGGGVKRKRPEASQTRLGAEAGIDSSGGVREQGDSEEEGVKERSEERGEVEGEGGDVAGTEKEQGNNHAAATSREEGVEEGGAGSQDEEDDVSSSSEEEEGGVSAEEEEDDEEEEEEEEEEDDDDVSEDEDDEENEYGSDVSEEKGPAATLDRRRGEVSGTLPLQSPLPAVQKMPQGYMHALLGRFPEEVRAGEALPRGNAQAELDSEEAFPIFEADEESEEEDAGR